jgi:excisionase family DNA binding protein
MSDLIAVPLPDGRWLALEPDVLRAALDAAESMGLRPPAPSSTKPTSLSALLPPERWLTSQQLEEATGVHSTTWEAKAKAGEVPCMRVGKALRFKLSEVEAALKGDI